MDAPKDNRRERRGFERTGQLHQLDDFQSRTAEDLKSEIGARWPLLTYSVGPAPVITRDGVIVVPKPEQIIRVDYQNGPPISDMKSLVNERTQSCRCFSTVGAVIWIGEQAGVSGNLRRRGIDVAEDVDLTAPAVVAQIALIDAWAEEVGLTNAALQEEGYEIQFAAYRIAKKSGNSWPPSPGERSEMLWKRLGYRVTRID